MAQQNLNLGAAPNDGTGDNYRVAFTKVQDNFNELFASNIYTKRVLVNSLSDLPPSVSNVITLAASTQYVLADDIDFGSDSLSFGNNTVLTGIDTVIITVTYAGAVPFFDMINVTCSVKNMNILHPNADIFNFIDSGGHAIRIVDVTSAGRSIGTLSGAGSLGRFTDFSPALTNGGASFSGNWITFLFDSAFGSIASGIFIDLGTATFDALALSRPSITLEAGTTYLSGLPNSGNINAGGGGTVTSGGFRGAGSVLLGVSAEDALWEFYHNNVIQDTRPDALLSLQGNAVAEAIAVAGTPVKVTGNNTWIDERSSQSTSDNTGRSTYNGGKPVVVPITMRGSVEPASGTNKTISLYVALNGTVIMGSKATANVDAGDPKSVTVIWQEEALPGDFVEMYASNDTDTTNVLVSSSVIRIN